MTFNLGIKKIWWIAEQPVPTAAYWIAEHNEGSPWYLIELRMPMPNLLWVNGKTGEIA
jgi:hypothetical protein